MSTRVYTGARYVPIFKGQWNDTLEYEPLSIVQYEGNSYTSKQHVPIGIAITNEDFWAITGNYNAQVEAYRQEVRAYDNRITDAQDDATEALRQIADVALQVTGLETQIEDFEEDVNLQISNFEQDVNTAIQDIEEIAKSELYELSELISDGDAVEFTGERTIDTAFKNFQSIIFNKNNYTIDNITVNGRTLAEIFSGYDEDGDGYNLWYNGFMQSNMFPQPFGEPLVNGSASKPIISSAESYVYDYSIQVSNSASCYYQLASIKNRVNVNNIYFSALKYKGVLRGGALGFQNMISTYLQTNNAIDEWQTLSGYGTFAESDISDTAALFFGGLPLYSGVLQSVYDGTCFIDCLTLINLNDIWSAANIPDEATITLAYNLYCALIAQEDFIKQFKIVREPVTNASNEECLQAFLNEANTILHGAGITTTFNSPSGYPTSQGSNYINAEEACKLAMLVFSNERVISWANLIRSSIKSSGMRDTIRAAFAQGTKLTQYTAAPTMRAKILASKGGSGIFAETNNEYIENQIGLTQIPIYQNTTNQDAQGKVGVYAIMNCKEGEINNAIWAVQDMLQQLVNSPNVAPTPSQYATYFTRTDPVGAAFAVLPLAPLAAFAQMPTSSIFNFGNYGTNFNTFNTQAYSIGSTNEHFAASISKLLTLYMLAQGGYDLNDTITITNFDEVGGSEGYFNAGDILTLENAARACAIFSDNESATAIARYIGSKILAQNYM